MTTSVKRDSDVEATSTGGSSGHSQTSRLWHELTVDDAYAAVGGGRHGLDAAEAQRRRDVHGPNALPEGKRRSIAAMLLAQFADVMILVLVGAAVISGVLGDLVDTLVIAAIVVLNGLLGFLQEFRSERALAALRAMAAPTATVVRPGGIETVEAAHLVPGDTVLLEAGRIVPADLRLVEVASLRVDESALTGESEHVDKHVEPIASRDVPVGDRRNLAFKGTSVAYGRGVGVVVATGARTEFGRIARLLADARAARTPLQRRLEGFGRRLAWIVLAVCAVVFAAGLARGEAALPMLLTALSLAVAAVPEALPAVVSIALALGARQMAAARALVRRLPAVETLGSVTYVCSDKTGTLTTNRMRVEQFWCDGELATTLGGTDAWQQLSRAMAISHDVTADSSGQWLGDASEVALVRAAGTDPTKALAAAPRVAEVPFDSTRKCMTTLHDLGPGRVLAVTKGAAEVVVERCVRELRGDGFAPVERDELRRVIDRMAADGLRVLAIAVREWDRVPDASLPADLEVSLDFVGLVGMIDPPRPEAPQAIATCATAGIVPVMITGDHPVTARAIAARIGFPEGPGTVMSGSELAACTDEELAGRVRAVRVYARVAPEQKVRIVRALQANGEVVAMTGDGVNDAPALRTADIGVSMGLSGTDVARESSAMVLLDDDFATVVGAVREGRRIYDNIRRFVRYVLTTNSAEIWTIFVAPFLGLPMPLLPIQILWMNLITDGLPALALASEAAERDVMRRPPRRPDESLFARGLGAHALLVGALMAGMALAVQAHGVAADSAGWQTTVFTALCFMQLAHALAIRSEVESLFTQGVTTNLPLLITVAVTVLLQLAVVYLPPIAALFRTAPLSAGELGLCIACAAATFCVVEAEKAFRRRARR